MLFRSRERERERVWNLAASATYSAAAHSLKFLPWQDSGKSLLRLGSGATGYEDVREQAMRFERREVAESEYSKVTMLPNCGGTHTSSFHLHLSPMSRRAALRMCNGGGGCPPTLGTLMHKSLHHNGFVPSHSS